MSRNKFNLSNQLQSSIKAEEEKVKDKFSRADLYLAKEEPLPLKNLEIEQEKVVREGFSLLKDEAALIEKIRFQVVEEDFIPSKSELLRAMILICSEMSTDKLRDGLRRLSPIKVGRKKQ